MAPSYFSKKLLLCCAFVVHFSPTQAIDNAHFYRAAYFWGEPRLEKNGLSTTDITIGFSSTRTGRNSNNEKVPLLSIYGPYSMQALGINVPGLDPNNRFDAILIELAKLGKRDTFGQLQFAGKFSIVEGVINIVQNIRDGFFVQAYLPIRRLEINDITFKDLSPRDMTEPNRYTPVWRAFLASFTEILQQNGLCIEPSKSSGAGDLSLLAGWTINYQETTHVDYVDITSKIGVLFPTGKRRSENKPFDLPTGYNGHFGLPVFVQASFGALEWFTLGGHTGALFFFDRKQNLRVKTSLEQNGLIKLAQENVEVDQGTLWTYGLYTKADHFGAGLSALVGYSFNKKDADTLELTTPSTVTTNAIINSDTTRQGWNMHVFNIGLEYDFAHDPCKPGIHIGFFYNRVLAGKRVFNAQVKSFSMGLDAVLTW